MEGQRTTCNLRMSILASLLWVLETDSLAPSTFTLLAGSLSTLLLPPFDTCTHNPPSCLSPLSTKPRLASNSAPPASVSTVRPALLPLFAHPAQAPSPCMSCTLRLQRGTPDSRPAPPRAAETLHRTSRHKAPPRPQLFSYPARGGAGPRGDPEVHSGRQARGPLSPSLRVPRESRGSRRRPPCPPDGRPSEPPRCAETRLLPLRRRLSRRLLRGWGRARPRPRRCAGHALGRHTRRNPQSGIGAGRVEATPA